jgi:hypothetical protein
MSCKPDSTHHYACDCREEYFKKIESQLAASRAREKELAKALRIRDKILSEMEKE